MTTTYHPRCKFQVNFQYASFRAFSFIDQTILGLLNAGAPLSEIPQLMGLPRRMVAESAFELLGENLLTMDTQTLVLSPLGQEWFSKLTEYRKSSVHEGSAAVYHDWNSGHTTAELSSDMLTSRSQASDEEAESGEAETIPFVHITGLLDQEDVQIFFENETFSPENWKQKSKELDQGFRSSRPHIEIAIRNALDLALQRESLKLFYLYPIEKPHSCYSYLYQMPSIRVCSEAMPIKPMIHDAHMPEDRWLLNERDHNQWLNHAFDEACTHLLIFSGHQSSDALEAINTKFSPTKGDSFLVVGYGNAPDAERIAPKAERLHHVVDPGASSDLKLVVYDDSDGVVHLCLGSFNWLQSYSVNNKTDDGMEISLVLDSKNHAATIFDILAYLGQFANTFTDKTTTSKLQFALSMLHQSIPAARARQAVESDDAVPCGSLFAAGVALANQCGYAMRIAQKRCLVLSHTLHERIPSFLALEQRSDPFEESCLIGFSAMYSRESGDTRISPQKIDEFIRKVNLKIQPDCNISIAHIPDMHARIVVNDDVVTISSLNFLSSSGAVKKSFGLSFRDPESAQRLVRLFAAHHTLEQPDAAVQGPSRTELTNLLRNLSPEEREQIFQNAGGGAIQK